MGLIKVIFVLSLLAGGVFLYKPNLFKKLEQEITNGDASSSKMVIENKDNAMNVLGATVHRITNSAKDIVEKMAGEQEEAIINQAVENISKQVKTLPEQQVKKIKYQFCRDIIEEELQKKEANDE